MTQASTDKEPDYLQTILSANQANIEDDKVLISILTKESALVNSRLQEALVSNLKYAQILNIRNLTIERLLGYIKDLREVIERLKKELTQSNAHRTSALEQRNVAKGINNMVLEVVIHALVSKADSSIVFIGKDGKKSIQRRDLAALLTKTIVPAKTLAEFNLETPPPMTGRIQFVQTFLETILTDYPECHYK